MVTKYTFEKYKIVVAIRVNIDKVIILCSDFDPR